MTSLEPISNNWLGKNFIATPPLTIALIETYSGLYQPSMMDPLTAFAKTSTIHV